MAGTTDVTLKWVRTTADAIEFLRWLDQRRPFLAIDTETGGFDWVTDALRTVQFGDRFTGWCLEWQLWAGTIKEAISQYAGPIVMHNCFSGETEIATRKGPATLRALANNTGTATVWTRAGWAKAIVSSFGVQAVQDITFGVTRSKSTLRQVVRATPNHHWELRDGTVTDHLRVGDQIPAIVPPVNRDDAEGYLHGLVYADGSKASGHMPAGPGRFKIRLCGWKASEAWRFEKVTQPPSYLGDPCGFVTSTRDLKALPDSTESLAYQASFIAGWAAFDGHRQPGKETGTVISLAMANAKAAESADWLLANGPSLGWLVTGDYAGEKHNAWTRPGGGYMRAITIAEDLHNRWWTVKAITKIAEPEEVFCATVPSIERFTLAGGLYTGNCKFDMSFLEVNGVELKRWLIHDSRTMAHVLDPVSYTGLKPKAAAVLGAWAWHGQEELKTAMTKGGWDWDDVPIELSWRYACFDTILTAQLAEELYPQVMASRAEIYGLEIASTQVLCDMERRGILTDQGYLRWANEEWGRDLAAIKHRIKEEYGIANPNSDAQVIATLRGQGWQPVLFTDKGNVKLDSDVLGGLVDSGSDLAARVLEYREVAKYLGTYVHNLIELADDKDDRIHCSINPLGARTGRMSVSRPSLQNLPAKDARIRNAFIAGDGQSLLSADFDQIEMRIFAHYANSPTMLESIRYGDQRAAQGHEGYDMHSMNARMVFGIGLDEPVPKHLRKRVKGVGFAKVYGAGLATFAATAGIPLGEAQQVIFQYEAAFPETKEQGFPAQVAEALHTRQRESNDPHVNTAYGRKEPCQPTVAFRAVNYLCQGTAADVLKDRLVALSRTWLGDHMLLPIHDEIIFEVPEDAVEEAKIAINEVMPERQKFAVPLTVDVVAVRRWGDKYTPMESSAHK